MADLYTAESVNPYDGLVVSAYPPADVFHVTLRKLDSAATLKRGTLLDLSTGTAGDGKMVIHGTTAGSNETLTANCILADDYEVGTAADVIAVAYRTGHFAENKLTVKSGASISATDKETLRDLGILLSDAFELS
jgi:hypothetical protein